MQTKITSIVMLALFPVICFAGSHDYVKPARAEFHLGRAYETGNGEPPSYPKAVYWYRKSADQGFARAENNLGVLYEARNHPSFTKARYWFRQAAKQGDITAEKNLAVFSLASGVSKYEVSSIARGAIYGGTRSGINGSLIYDTIKGLMRGSSME